ncbi:MAG TPA: cytochrome d ubiquinol oxidase subunit II [Candidatus Limnocylindrales bacterium]|nr:cytochrome d ubiquinol oxidase subunit II [Candidatus Limnocylindrales bacterium]
MATLWFCLVALMLTLYAVLDGFDIGAGIIHLFAAKTDAERRIVLRSIGPVWDGNEVWLIAAGGTLFLSFPALYAASFSGFYLPLMIVLWLLILRGISIELRSHLEGPVWAPFWDAVFALSSCLLAIFFGAALGNVVRGVPMDANGRFFEPLWTDFRPEGDAGILDWYTVSVGLAAFCALALHGALWVTLKTRDSIRDRARRIATVAWWSVVMLTAAITLFSLRIQPQIVSNLSAHPWGCVFPGLALLGLIGAYRFHVTRREGRAFVSSCAYIAGMIASAAFGIYPNVLPSLTGPARALTVANAAAPEHGLRIALVWWVAGVALAIAYIAFTYSRFAGKVAPETEGY